MVCTVMVSSDSLHHRVVSGTLAHKSKGENTKEEGGTAGAPKK